jgi:hypothetical protein
MIVGLLWSPAQGFPFIVKNIEFIPAYFLQLVGFQLFALVMALLIKRSGLVLALLIFYVYVIEPIVEAIIRYHYKLVWLADILPMSGIGGVIPQPFTKYLLQETQTFVAASDVLVCLIYIGLFIWISLRVIEKRDLT